MKRIVLILCILVLAGGLFWLFPLFHVVRLDELRNEERASRFDAAKFTKTFWNNRLVPSLDQAPEAGALLTALAENTSSARRDVGRKVGLGRSRLFVLQGRGTIVSVDKNGVGIALDDSGRAEPDIVLHTGLLFGNVARDATGLLEASDFPHSQNFNDISTELNRIIEERMIAKLSEQAGIGKKVQFYGCAEVPDAVRDARPLPVIPLKVNVE